MQFKQRINFIVNWSTSYICFDTIFLASNPYDSYECNIIGVGRFRILGGGGEGGQGLEC